MATYFTNAGKAHVAGALTGDVSVAASYWVAWGTGTGINATGTTLKTAAPEARVSANPTRTTTTVSNDTMQSVATITATNTRAITEAGLFTASSSGTMVVYGDFAAINLTSGDSVQFTVGLKMA